MEDRERKTKLPAWAVVLLVVGMLGCGTKQYVDEAKAAEGRQTVTAIARGMASAGEAGGKAAPPTLPPSSKPIPATLSMVSGKKYQSSVTEWTSDPAFKAARFMMTSPQYFQYMWEKTSPTTGTVRAIADMNGDGEADLTFEVDVTCNAGSCTSSPLRKK